MTPESKKLCQLSVGDIISNLPRDAIDNILTCLPLRDAVRTCVLSRRWRYMWANLPSLVLDQETFSTENIRSEDGLVVRIYQVLLLKRVPILKFVLSLPGLYSSRHIDLLLAFLARNRGLQELELLLWKGADWYKLPASLFSCLELTHLSLWKCVLEPPTQFKGFNKLVSLEMYYCEILPDVLSGLISSCPLLEELTVESNTPVKGHIQISAPNLRDLSFTAEFASISFEYAPRLSSCRLWLPEGLPLPGRETTSNVLFQSLQNLIAVKDLDFHYYYAVYKLVDSRKSLPRKLTTTLNHLTSLTLSMICFELLHEVSHVLCLIRSSPNLTKISVFEIRRIDETNDADMERNLQLLEVQEWSDVSLKSLREVEVDQITVNTPELRFIKLLLAISPKLEKMIVTPNVSMAQKERFEILKMMTRFRRLSPLAEIIYRSYL